MIVATIYEVDMAKYVYVQLTGNPTPQKVKADKVEEDTAKGYLVITDYRGNMIGKFRAADVAGWWIVES